MKFDGLGVILAIILLPIILVVTYYIQLQVDTIATQNSYNTKLLDATYDAMSAFEINTANEELSNVADSMRSIILASNNVLLNSLATNFGMSNASKEYLLPYVPAILYTMYDGYYIYAPTETPKVAMNTKQKDDSELIITNGYRYYGQDQTFDTDKFKDENPIYGDIIYEAEDGGYTVKKDKAKTETDYILKPYVQYSARYKNESEKIDVTINYTLDNYLNIIGKIDDNFYTKTGYLIKDGLVIQVKYNENSDMDFDDNEENVKNKILGKRNVASGEVTSAASNPSVTLKTSDNNNISIDADFSNITNITGSDVQTIGDAEEFLKKLYDKNDGNSEEIQELEYEIQKYKAIAYYASSACFSNWVYEYLGELTYESIQDDAMQKFYNNNKSKFNSKVDGDLYYNFKNDAVKDNKIFDKDENPEDYDSKFNAHKLEVIKNSIKYNLNLSMSAYNKMDKKLKDYNASMPVLLDEEWDKILNNISIVSFMQGWDCGLTIYNNYEIVSSTNNELTVTPSEIYYVPKNKFNDGESEYHRVDHLPEKDDDNTSIVDYISFKSKEVKYDKIYDSSSGKYKYDHKNLACYTCINTNNYENQQLTSKQSFYKAIDKLNPNQKKAAYIALAKERQNIYKTNALSESVGFKTVNGKVKPMNLSDISKLEITVQKNDADGDSLISVNIFGKDYTLINQKNPQTIVVDVSNVNGENEIKVDGFEVINVKAYIGTSNENVVERPKDKIDNTIIVSPRNNLKYNGYAQNLITTLHVQGTVYYSLDTELNENNYTEKGSTEIPIGKNAGTYTIYWYSPGNANYKAKGGKIEVNIGKTTPELILDRTSGFVVVGKNNTFNATSSVAGRLTVTSTNESYVKITSAAISDVLANKATKIEYNGINVPSGDVNITVKISPTDNANYNEKEVTFRAKISSTDNSISVVAKKNLKYNGSAQELVSVSNNQGDLYFSLKESLNSNNYTTGDKNIPTGTNVGTYRVYWYTPGNANYKATSGNVDVTINKGRNNVYVIKKDNLIYNGKNQELVNVLNKHGDVYFSLTKSLDASNYTTGSKNIPTGKDAGTYTVYWYTPGNDNYLDEKGFLNVEIKIITEADFEMRPSNGSIACGASNIFELKANVAGTFKIRANSGVKYVSVKGPNQDQGSDTVIYTVSANSSVNIQYVGQSVTGENPEILIVSFTPADTKNYVKPADKFFAVTVTEASFGGNVKIVGNNTWGETLKADVSNNNNAKLTYQWYASETKGATSGGTKISNATSENYKIDKSLVGKYIYVEVTFSKYNYTTITFADSTDATNNKTDAVAKQNLTVQVTNYENKYDSRAHSAIIVVTTNDWIGGTILSGTNTDYGYTVTSSGTANKVYNLQPTYKEPTNGEKTIYYKVLGGNYYNDKLGEAKVNITQAGKYGKVIEELGKVISNNKEMKYKWRYFYDDDSNIYLIYENLLEHEQIPIHHKVNSNIYYILSVENKILHRGGSMYDFYEYFRWDAKNNGGSRIWQNIAEGIQNSLKEKGINTNVEVTGSPSVDIFNKSYNTNHTDDKFSSKDVWDSQQHRICV